MPSITLMPSACTSGTSGWINLYYHSTNQNSAQPRQLIFTFPANATLGGAGINITGITLHAYVRNSASAVKQLQYGCKTGTGAAPTAWAQESGANVLDWAFTAVGASNGSYIEKWVSRVLSGAALERFAAHMQARFAAGQALYLGVVQPQYDKSIQVNLALGNWIIDVTYELLGNVPSANVSAATLGSTAITTTLNKVVTGSSTTLRYKIGSQTIHTQDVGTGASHTYTVPASAGQYFPNAQRATLTIEAETFVGGTSYGTVSTSVTLNSARRRRADGDVYAVTDVGERSGERGADRGLCAEQERRFLRAQRHGQIRGEHRILPPDGREQDLHAHGQRQHSAFAHCGERGGVVQLHGDGQPRAGAHVYRPFDRAGVARAADRRIRRGARDVRQRKRRRRHLRAGDGAGNCEHAAGGRGAEKQPQHIMCATGRRGRAHGRTATR